MVDLSREILITDSISKKGKHVLKRFECKECGQMYIYIVKHETNSVKCNICNININAKGEV